LEKALLADPKERAEHIMHIVSSVEGKAAAAG
jgi:anthranilate/para-aminobenzoate synthase component I